jgi:O-antigen biosynthesis protein WbqP
MPQKRKRCIVSDVKKRQVILKRIFDFVLAAILIVPAIVICILALPIVWLETGASPLFFQNRVGRDKVVFKILKLRTMRFNTANVASHEVNTSQITRSGGILRKYKIDELPQIWNVLNGSMSFVGPRPCLPTQTDLIGARDRLGIYTLRPGITGPAQIAGIDMSTPILLADYDANYLVPWSMIRDIKVLISTILGNGSGDAAIKR